MSGVIDVRLKVVEVSAVAAAGPISAMLTAAAIVSALASATIVAGAAASTRTFSTDSADTWATAAFRPRTSDVSALIFRSARTILPRWTVRPLLLRWWCLLLLGFGFFGHKNLFYLLGPSVASLAHSSATRPDGRSFMLC